MVNSCATCAKSIRAIQYTKCSECDNSYHPLCAKITDFRKWSEADKATWLCTSCRNKKLSSSNFSTPKQNGHVDLKNDTSSCSLLFNTPTAGLDPGSLSQLTSEIKLLREDVGDLKYHLKTLTEHLTLCNQRLEVSEASLASAEAKIQVLEERVSEIPYLKSTIQQLNEQLQSHAQGNLTNQVEILGVTETANENPVHIILTAAVKIGINLEDSDLEYVTRAGPRHSDSTEITANAPVEKHPRPLVVKFLRRNKRNEFLRAAKTRRNISSEDLDLPGTRRVVFFNERLTKENRLLLRAAKPRAKECGFKYCWIKNGSIYIRKHEGHPAIAIRNQYDLVRNCPYPPAQTEAQRSVPM